MRLNLGTRLFLSFFGVTLLGLGTAGYLVDRNVETSAYEQMSDRLRYEVTMTAQMTASALFAPLAKGDTSLQAPVRELGAAVHTQLSLVAPDGALSADSDEETVDPNRSEADAPEVRQAQATGRGTAVRGAGAGKRLWVAEAIRRDGSLLGIARASVPTSVVQAQVNAVRKRLALGALIALLIAMLSAVLIAMGIVRPVQRLATAARRLGKGDLAVRANVTQNDELGDLGHAVDDMASNLQQMVARLDERNVQMRRVLDSIDQGLFMVDASGGISVERSLCIDTWFGTPKPGTPLWDLIAGASLLARRNFRSGWLQISDDILPIEVALDQLPTRLDAGAATFSLQYTAVGSDPVTRCVLVVITDVTQLVAAEHIEEVQRDVLRAVERTQRDRQGFLDFLRDADQLVTTIKNGGGNPTDEQRRIHTIKGNCGVYGLHSIAALCHELETKLRGQSRGLSDDERALLGARWADLRASLQPLLGDRSAEIAVMRAQYRDVLSATLNGASPEVTASKLAQWTLTPCETSFQRLGEHATLLAAKLGKEVELSIDGGGVWLDGERWGSFWASLVHAIRNAIDHGIEAPEERLAEGKIASGILKLAATLGSSQFLIQLQDDGRGIVWPRIAARLRERGQPAETAEQLMEGLFADGISTAEAVTDVSGRGVGMGALRQAVRELGGTITVHSTLHSGTTLRCSFPASCAMVDPFLVLERELARLTSLRPPRLKGDAEGGSHPHAA